MMMLRGTRVILRDMIAGDLADYERWLTVETEWQRWDSPWEVWDAEAVRRYLDWRRELLAHPLPPIRSRFEICTVMGTHIGWVTCYPMEGAERQPAVGIDIPSPAFRGQGLGREAFGLFVSYIAGHYPHLPVCCQTWSGNAAMCALARSAGFVLHDCRPGAYRIDGKPYDALTYRYRRPSEISG